MGNLYHKYCQLDIIKTNNNKGNKSKCDAMFFCVLASQTPIKTEILRSEGGGGGGQNKFEAVLVFCISVLFVGIFCIHCGIFEVGEHTASHKL